ncbi:hypothetical protein J5N97_024047 [Dioscorea zingiberensis]|uniref:Uncharacterized protein n=1 Tax=Dioscorea zingiberensis TaxID=325984 RepID=A0A9D5C655_9LILI|nr:hypothetical protein J5N97_024047 [Dioscorea zingiberensis]
MEEEVAAFGLAMKLGCNGAVSMTLKAVIELDVLEIIAAEGPGAWLSPEEITSRIETTNPDAPEVLDRMLRFLASNNVVRCDVVSGEDGKIQRRYGLAPVCKFLMKNEDGASLAPLVLLRNSNVVLDSWSNLKYAVIEGTVPFVKAHGMTLYEYHDKNPMFTELFNKAMFTHSTLLLKKMLEKYKGFESLKVLVDVAGGLGATLGIILSKYPHIKGINFDLPFVISQATNIPGVEHVGGDMFDSVPTGDGIILKYILHNWSDEHCVKILSNCWKVLPDTGMVIVVENILPESPEDSDEANITFLDDLAMLTCFDGGKERTLKEYKCLAKESGFSRFKDVCYVYGSWIMELYK